MSGIKNARREWYTHEERLLVTMWKAGENGDAIALAVGHSRASVYCYVKKHHARLGISTRSSVPWRPVELNLVERELELAIRRIGAGLPHRNRPAITQRMTAFLFGDSKRLKKRARTAEIVKAVA